MVWYGTKCVTLNYGMVYVEWNGMLCYVLMRDAQSFFLEYRIDFKLKMRFIVSSWEFEV
jgi:hypothetical protein